MFDFNGGDILTKWQILAPLAVQIVTILGLVSDNFKG